MTLHFHWFLLTDGDGLTSSVAATGSPPEANVMRRGPWSPVRRLVVTPDLGVTTPR